MEQPIAEKPLPQEQQYSQLHISRNGAMNSGAAHFKRDPPHSRYTGRWTRGDSNSTPSGCFNGNDLKEDKSHRSVCRDNLHGRCARGSSCKYLHSDFIEYDRSKFFRDDQQNLSSVEDSRNSQFLGKRKDGDSSRMSSYSREPMHRFPCHNFRRGQCHYGDSCRNWHDHSAPQQPDIALSSSKAGFVDRSLDISSWGHDEADERNNLRNRSYSRVPRASSPCRNFHLGKCRFGTSCRRSHDQNALQSGAVGVYSRPGFVDGSLDMSSRGHNEANQHNNLRSESFSRRPRISSPCRNFLQGRCRFGESCDRRHDQSALRPGAVGAYSKSGTLDGSLVVSSRGHDEGNQHYTPRTDSFSRGPRISSPCRSFLQGRCRFGESCRRLHDQSAQQQPGIVFSSSKPVFLAGSLDTNSQEHDKAIRHNNLRNDSYSRGARTRSPCQFFLRGSCHGGTSSANSHPVSVYGRSRYELGAQQHQGAPATSRNHHFHGGFIDRGVKSHGLREFSIHEQNRQWRTEEQLACNRGNRDGPLSIRSFEKQSSWPACSFAGDKLRPEFCLRFTKGRCENGESCKYLHSFHEYASSISQRSENPRLGSADLMSNGGGNQCTTTLVAREHDSVRSDKMHSVDHSLVSLDDTYDKENKGGSLDGSVNPVILDKQGEVLAGAECEIGTSSGRINDMNLWSPPFKRQRGWTRSPVTPEDVSNCRRLRQDCSSTDCRKSSQDHDSPSSKLTRPPSHMNKQHLRVAETSISSSFNQHMEPTVMPPKVNGEVVSGCKMQLQQCASSISNPEADVLSKQMEDESEGDASAPILVNQNDEGVTADSVVDDSKGTATIDEECMELDLTKTSEGHHSVPGDVTMVMLDKNENGDLVNHKSQIGNDKTEEVKQAVKTYFRKKRKRASTEETTDAPSSVLPIISVGETSISQQNSVHYCSVSKDLNTSAARNNVMVDEHPVEQRIKGSVTNNLQNHVETSGVVTEVSALLIGNMDHNLLPPSQSSVSGVPSSKRKLLVLDINGILVDIVAEYPHRYKPHSKLAGKAVFKRRFCDNFLEFCFETFDVGIWSSRTKKNVYRVINSIMKNTEKKLLFCWDQSHCTVTGYQTVENNEKPLVLKELKKLWEKQDKDLPWERGFYNETNTVLLDDSPYKALRNPPYTAIFPPPYSFRDVKDKSLGPNGELRLYLEKLAKAENVQKFIQENPFGQRAITKSNLSWGFYSKIAGTYGSKEEGNANNGPHSS